MPNSEVQPLRRRPKPAYKNLNGFMDPTRMRIQGQMPTVNLHGDPSGSREADFSRAKNVRDAVERRRNVEDALLLKGSFFPGLAAAKELVESPETAAGTERRIQELRVRHWDEMQTLLDWQTQDYFQEAMDRHDSNNDDQKSNSDEDVHADRHFESFYQSLHTDPAPFSCFDDVLSAHRYAHLRTINGLLNQHAAQAEKEDAARRKRDAQFPAGIEEYRAIRNKDIQIRMARFLMADSNTKDRMMSEFQWAWRQVQSLVDEFSKNVRFSRNVSEILARHQAHQPAQGLVLVEDFKREVESAIRQTEATDPRRKPSTA
ncbi:uncharacterized protein FIBRA_04719 [Fibroporia radiculosa]|uniref:Uncharacterized protein n=1 Tax=Fibroporia radiculosa TaxID=599839 RepID=J4IAB4_9APHY|nr:uncharacterized protein FIBRA_04719 [Fibroporia radiculosa]CCM02616.1 predicted protein [Fibroporia radiculosa]